MESGVERGRKIGRKSRWRDKQNLVKKRRCSKRESEKVGIKRSRGKEKEKKKTGTGRDVLNNICEGGRKRTGSSGCVREKAFQTTSVMRATSVMRGREERFSERKRRS